MAVIMLAVACSVEKHYRTLSFFFDGVPDPEAARRTALPDSLKSAAADTSHLGTVSPELSFNFHQPYIEKKCDDCHNRGSMGSLALPMPGLCYQCHKELGVDKTWQHGPSSGGYCTQCHEPHRSKNEKLLKKTGSALCFGCHDSRMLEGGGFHDDPENSSCTGCHNPHGSENHSLLRTDVCYQCHENYAGKYKVLHGPVAAGYCSRCHAPHRNENEKHLNMQVNSLCLGCHDEKQVMAGKSHNDIKKGVCTDCHNPHGGENLNYLNRPTI